MELDTLYIHTIKTDGQHNYLAEIDPTEVLPEETYTGPSVPDKMMQALNDLLNSEVGQGIGLGLLALLLGVVVYMICQHFSFFEVSKKSEAKGMANDTIYGHKWDEELQALMAKGDYSEAVVLCYLHLIDMLNSRKMIEFMVSKTPQMFLDEARAYTPLSGDATIKDTICPKLQILTNHYLRIRYGHRQASEELAKELIEQDAMLVSLSNEE